MFSAESIDGSEMQDKTLCLTYDDGPGPHTLEIASFLHENRIRATFFVVGKYAWHHRDILARLRDMGHIVANHTYDHPDIPYYCSVDGDIQDQVIRTNAVIREYINGQTVFFRPPYGKWSPEVAAELNLNILSAVNHVGPVYWDIPGIDCYYWKNGKTVDETCDKYLSDIAEKGKGIVVMHDHLADMDYLQPLNKTTELTKKLVPMLLAQGYKFLALDELESVKTAISKGNKFAIGFKNHFAALGSEGKIRAAQTGKRDPACQWELVYTGYGKVAFRSGNGMYMHVNPLENETVLANSKEIGQYGQFDLVPVRDNEFILRTNNGHYIAIGKDGTLQASAEFMRQAAILGYYPLDVEIRTKKSLKKKLELMNKRFKFIKSKLLQS